MPMRIAAPFLSLLGHELRAPAGVVGGYLALIEQDLDRLSPQQRQALAGARRAQQALVEHLDDLRRLTIAWKAELEPLTSMALGQLAQEVTQIAAARHVPLRVVATEAVAVPRRGRDSALAEGLVTVAEAVAREHGLDVVATTHLAGEDLVWRVSPAGLEVPATATRHAFDMNRPGLGVRLVSAAVTIASSRGRLDDLRVGSERAGVDVSFTLTGAEPPASDIYDA